VGSGRVLFVGVFFVRVFLAGVALVGVIGVIAFRVVVKPAFLGLAGFDVDVVEVAGI
jgi:hypothetical protein